MIWEKKILVSEFVSAIIDTVSSKRILARQVIDKCREMEAFQSLEAFPTYGRTALH